MKKIFSFILLLSLLLILTGCPPLNKDDPSVTGALNVHFIDVGQADCALIECNGEYILIDGGNVEDSQLVVSYLQRQGVEELLAACRDYFSETGRRISFEYTLIAGENDSVSVNW